MPGIVRKLLVCAAVDGLLLIPQKQHPKGSPSLTVEYTSGKIQTSASPPKRDSNSLEAYGIVGLLRVASKPYLIAITSRKQVAQIKGKAIYVVSGVSIIPATSQAEAKNAIELAKKTPKTKNASSTIAEDDDNGSSDEDEYDSGDVTADDDDGSMDPSEETTNTTATSASDKISSVAQDVIGRKGNYGRFADRWFSKKGWAADKRRVSVSVSDKNAPSRGTAEVLSARDTNADRVTLSLLPKLLRTTKLLLNSRSFYFSYDHDITRRLGSDEKPDTDWPLNKRVDDMFFWNKSLSKPLSEEGYHSFVIPLMQGYIGQRAFSIEKGAEGLADSIAHVKEDVGEVIELQETAVSREARQEAATEPEQQVTDWLVTLISRRSVLRAGLRYLRRGVDERGHVANSVETEQILSDSAWSDASKTYSFTQIRGSIPIFFSQSPYSFKPVPILHHSYEINHDAFVRHFSDLRRRYGKVQIAMLVEKTGPEAKVGDKFAEHTEALNKDSADEAKVGFEWFDFHKICAGMKFEKVSILMDILQPTLAGYGVAVEQGGSVVSRQTGVLRTNCMDCLDRTNVVQSAVGAHSLQAQLAAEGINLDLEHDASGAQWFNALWADNGDAVSKQYSSTAALKGDYTRTRRRDYRGALNDFGLTLTRYFNNVVNDYFSQAAIDFLLGTVTDAVFEEFEASLKTADPGVSVTRARQMAIDTAAKIVIADQDEELTGGWTVQAPAQPDTLRAAGGVLDEIVLLVTQAAIYPVRFDWNTEKVAGFERIDLDSIVHVRKGTYVTSTLSAAQLDPQRNVGLVVTYRPAPTNLVRVNTRSMSTAGIAEEPVKAEGAADQQPDKEPDQEIKADAAEDSLKKKADAAVTKADAAKLPQLLGGSSADSKLRLAAFKALPARSSVAAGGSGRDSTTTQLTEQEVVADICAHINAAVAELRDASDLVEEADIIGVDEAKRSTGLLEQWSHTLKKFVWA